MASRRGPNKGESRMSAPQWTRSMTVVWVVEGDEQRCEDVGSAHVVTRAYAAAASTAAELTPRLKELRARGATVKTQEGAPPALRAAARALRGRLAVLVPAAHAEVARDISEPDIAAALDAWPPATPVDYSNLFTRTASGTGCPPLTRTSRLLLALEDLV